MTRAPDPTARTFLAVERPAVMLSALEPVEQAVAFVSGHLDLTDEEFARHYVPLIADAVARGWRFVVGDAMTAASSRDIAWVRPGRERSGTARNLRRRAGGRG